MAATDTTVISDYSDFLKEFYLPVIQQERKRRNVFLDDEVIKFDREHIAGKYALIPVEFRFFGGTGSRAENGMMPIPDAGQYDTAKVSLVYSFMTMQLSKQLMQLSEGERASFNNAVAQITATNMNSWLTHLSRMVLGNGLAVLCMVDGTATSHAFDIDNAYGISATDLGSNGNGDLFISENMRINVFNGNTKITDGGSGGDGVIAISAFTRGDGDTEATITVDDEGTIADGYNIVLDGVKATAASGSYEANGLMLCIDDGTLAGTFQNISSTTRPEYVAWVKYGDTPGTVEPLTRARMNAVKKNIEMRAGGKVDMIFCGVDTMETYLELADSLSLVTNQKALDAAGNWEGPTFMGIPIISDPNYVEGRMEFIQRDALAIYEDRPADWVAGDVGVLQKVAGYANYVAEFCWFWQFGVRCRSHLGSLRDIELTV